MSNILQNIAKDLLNSNNHRVDLNNDIDLDNLSSKIKLFSYQREALRHMIVILDLYYKDKVSLKYYYENKGFDEEKYKKEKLTIFKIFNRASFWMATGSGKSIVMIKLVEILSQMANKGYIDENDILILAPNNKILKQIKNQINEFNKYSNFSIRLKSLKKYDKIKHETSSLFEQDGITVFYYRSDLIDNEANVSKKKSGKRLNYKDYLNSGFRVELFIYNMSRKNDEIIDRYVAFDLDKIF